MFLSDALASVISLFCVAGVLEVLGPVSVSVRLLSAVVVNAVLNRNPYAVNAMFSWSLKLRCSFHEVIEIQLYLTYVDSKSSCVVL